MMKKMMFGLIGVLALAFSVEAYGLTTVQARKMNNAQLKVAMQELTEDGLVEFCRAVFAGNDRVLQSRIRVQLQSIMRTMPTAKATSLARTINAAVPSLSFGVSGNGNVVVTDANSSVDSTASEGSYVPRGDSSTTPVSSGATRTGI